MMVLKPRMDSAAKRQPKSSGTGLARVWPRKLGLWRTRNTRAGRPCHHPARKFAQAAKLLGI